MYGHKYRVASTWLVLLCGATVLCGDIEKLDINSRTAYVISEISNGGMAQKAQIEFYKDLDGAIGSVHLCSAQLTLENIRLVSSLSSIKELRVSVSKENPLNKDLVKYINEMKSLRKIVLLSCDGTARFGGLEMSRF